VGQRYDRIDERLRGFLQAQHVFFVATAPDGPDGHVNVSPKGLRDTFAVLDDGTVAYLDLTGSGAETIAHLRQNGRITLMFCAFDGAPRIVRLYGRGRVVLRTDPEWAQLSARFPPLPGRRSVVVVELTRIADSCGYGVPLFDLAGERDLLPRWAQRKGEDGIAAYQAESNATSIDGLPALDR
jgi:hypothetical protein